MLGKVQVQVMPMDGGLNTNAKPWLIGTSEAQRLDNIDLSKSGKAGGLCKRSGCTADNVTQFVSGVVTNVYKYLKEDGTSSYLLAHCSTAPLYYKTPAGVLTTVTLGAGTNIVWMTSFTNTLYIASKDISMYQWNGTNDAAVATGTPPANTVAGLEVYQNRLWTANNAATPNKLWGSALFNPNDWTTDNSAFNTLVSPGDGDSIQRIISQGTRLVIFKKEAIYALYGNAPTNFYIEKLTNKTGIISPMSAVSAEGIIFFRGRNGIYGLTERGAEPELISTKIQDKVDAQTNSTTCCGMVYKDQYWLTYTSSSVTNGNLVLFYKTGKWGEYKGLPNEALYCKDDVPYGASSGRIYNLDTGVSDSGTSISVFYKSPAFFYGDFSKDKNLDKCYITAKTDGTHTITIDHYVDLRDNSDSHDYSLAQTGTEQINTIKLQWKQGSVGKFQEFAISETSTYALEVYGMNLYATLKEEK